MPKSKALEIAIVTLVLGGALTYQIMHKKAVQKGAVSKIAPELPVQVSPRPLVVEKKQDSEVTDPQTASLISDLLATLKVQPVRNYDPHLSSLGEAPDWDELDKYQETLTKLDFERLITTVYTIGDSWKKWIEIEQDYALIVKNAGDLEQEPYRLNFAKETNQPVPRIWRNPKQLGPAPEGKPLDGMVIAIDPGHLGGEQWARLEERSFAVGDDKPVREGVITLQTSKILKVQLERLGAKTVLVRDDLEPLNPKRPKNYTHDAYEELLGRGLLASAPEINALRNKMFYRIGEIRTRASITNHIIKPDLVICIHFNAETWGDPENPELRESGHFHVLLHGAVTEGELAKDDERFSMLKKILTRNHDLEVGVCEEVAQASVEVNNLPAYRYRSNSSRARNIKGNDYLWARNLLANRLYESPVIYMEPYVMNSKVDYARIQLGDYDGVKMVNGVEYPSIFREYATGVTNGLKKYYREKRGVKKENLKEVEQADE